jgi:tRNA pseudouridine55 synthase
MMTSGLLYVDKPAGLTSHDVVGVVRRAARTRRVGHAGTLDPFATGLLVLAINSATRLLPYVGGEPKVYEAVIRFGVAAWNGSVAIGVICTDDAVSGTATRC